MLSFPERCFEMAEEASRCSGMFLPLLPEHARTPAMFYYEVALDVPPKKRNCLKCSPLSRSLLNNVARNALACEAVQRYHRKLAAQGVAQGVRATSPPDAYFGSLCCLPSQEERLHCVAAAVRWMCLTSSMRP